MTTDYTDTFITVSPDSTAACGKTPAKADSAAGLQHALLTERPYAFTSDDLLFEVHARRHGIADGEREAVRQAFFAKPQACLRTSALVKQHGWGLHHDSNAKVAAYGVETEAYRELTASPGVKVVPGVRSRRA